jgi:hypothetical protein
MLNTSFLLQYDRRLVMPWLVDNAMTCGLLFLVLIGGAITCIIVTATRINDDLTVVTYGFIIMLSGAILVGNTDATVHYSWFVMTCPLR